LFGEAICDADAVPDDVRGFVVDTLGDPDATLILDDTGDIGLLTQGGDRRPRSVHRSRSAPSCPVRRRRRCE
jgi:hypothetical protein